MPAPRDLTGQRFNMLTVLARVDRHPTKGWLWRCRCDCGGYSVVSSGRLRFTKSCGCYSRVAPHIAKGNELHGLSKSPEFAVWANMKDRCGHLAGPGQENYAGRGIKVCQRWQDSFLAFLHDMGPRPSSEHSIERVDNDGDYEPSNCRWSLYRDQINNRRKTVKIKLGDVEKPLTVWAEEKGIPRATLWQRIRSGMSPEDALKPASMDTITIGDETKTVPEWGEILGVTRTSAYRLHRQGRLIPRIMENNTLP